MDNKTAYDHGFYGTLAREEIPADVVGAFDEGARDVREVEIAEMAHEAQMRDCYGDVGWRN